MNNAGILRLDGKRPRWGRYRAELYQIRGAQRLRLVIDGPGALAIKRWRFVGGHYPAEE